MNVLFVLSTQIKLPSKLLLANTLIMIRYSDPMPTHSSNLLLFVKKNTCEYPSLVKACISIPGISDHSIVLADCDLKATINPLTTKLVPFCSSY